MCGIVAAVTNDDIVNSLLQGLKKLEYRGYDSAGIAVLNNESKINLVRVKGKVSALQAKCIETPIAGSIGIAHTRWATHGEPNQRNAHPHVVENRIAVVHNGIIENFQALREPLILKGYEFKSETDSEVIAVLLYDILRYEANLLEAINQTLNVLQGAYALCIMDALHPGQLIAIRKGSPVSIGESNTGYYIASDSLAFHDICSKFTYLEENDIAIVTQKSINIFDARLKKINRKFKLQDNIEQDVQKGNFPHYMLKEILEQPHSLKRTLDKAIINETINDAIFGTRAKEIFDKVKQVVIIGCGSSYHSGMIAKFWFEELAGIACEVEISSEFRYRKKITRPGTLLLCLSQSGETADTLAALKSTLSDLNYCGRLGIGNVAHSSMQREAELFFLTAAWLEVGVCSTKTFTAQLLALLILSLQLGLRHKLSAEKFNSLIKQLYQLSALTEEFLSYAKEIEYEAKKIINNKSCLFLGRGIYFPVALEGALKLKEISYIHAEAYPAGELKHGPLALVDSHMPIIVVAPSYNLFEKMKSNIEEVLARHGKVLVITNKDAVLNEHKNLTVLRLPNVPEMLAPILYNLPLQLLSYYVSAAKGLDVDQPRNLAKSVTVE